MDSNNGYIKIRKMFAKIAKRAKEKMFVDRVMRERIYKEIADYEAEKKAK